jgi:hypothetical protein
MDHGGEKPKNTQKKHADLYLNNLVYPLLGYALDTDILWQNL